MAIVEATEEFAACYKPNSAFYEVMGAPGLEVLQAVIAAIPGRLPVILDNKRGDVGNTATHYARATFDVMGAGAATVNPYLGRDSVQPYLDYSDRGVFLLCRTSNPGAADLQNLAVGDRPLYLEVARRAREWDDNHNVGLVVGATWPDDVSEIRAECPGMPLLLPGAGAQGGDAVTAARNAAGPSGRDLFVVSSSRGVMHASGGNDFQHRASDAARALRDQVETGL